MTHGTYPFLIEIDDVVYTVRASSPHLKTLGDCEKPIVPGRKRGPVIRIRPGAATAIDEATTLTHEVLHACNWYADEEWIVMASEAIIEALRKAGLIR